MAKICFVRFRNWGADYPPMVDVQYESGRIVSLGAEELPRTVKAFLQNAKIQFAYNGLYGRYVIYWPGV